MNIQSDLYVGNIQEANNDVQITLQFNPSLPIQQLAYIAPSPADYRASYSGSGLPFPNKEHAFEGTPNHGVVDVYGNQVTLRLAMPNAYYDDFNGTIVQPHVLCMAIYKDQKKDFVINLGYKIPYRSLTYPTTRKDTMFYSHGWSLPVRTQENVLRDGGYPVVNSEAPNFWGLRPPA
jgi:hypothetical protein